MFFLLIPLHTTTQLMYPELLAIASIKTKNPIKNSLQFAWNEFLKDPWMYILYTFIAMVINLILFKIPIIGPLVLIIIGLPLQLGVSIYFYKKNNFNDLKFKHFFDGFLQTKDLLKVFLIIIASTLVLLIPLFIIVVLGEVGVGNTTDAFTMPTKIAVVLYSPIILFLSICIILSPYFIYYFKTDALQSIKLSYYFIKPRWFSFLKFYIIIFLIGALGAISILGLLITTPIISLAMFHQFFTITKLPMQQIDETSTISVKDIFKFAH